MTGSTDVLLDGRWFCEGPRSRDERFVVSDMHGDVVLAVGLDGTVDELVAVGQQPSGLGWLPDGRMLVVSMLDRRVLRLEREGLVEHADLSALTVHACNDMVVDAAGRAYVGSFGFDLDAFLAEHGIEAALGEPGPPRAPLVRVEPDGTATVVAEDLRFPNGMVLTPDGGTLVVAESLGLRLTAFDVAEDGSLSGRRLWAPTGLVIPDGIAFDAEGAVWTSNPGGTEVLRLAQGGEVLDRVATSQPSFAVALGGPDGRHLLVCTAPTSSREVLRRAPTARLEVAEVAVPAAA